MRFLLHRVIWTLSLKDPSSRFATTEDSKHSANLQGLDRLLIFICGTSIVKNTNNKCANQTARIDMLFCYLHAIQSGFDVTRHIQERHSFIIPTIQRPLIEYVYFCNAKDDIRISFNKFTYINFILSETYLLSVGNFANNLFYLLYMINSYKQFVSGSKLLDTPMVYRKNNYKKVKKKTSNVSRHKTSMHPFSSRTGFDLDLNC